MTGSFEDNLNKALNVNRSNNYRDNYESRRFGKYKFLPLKNYVKKKVKDVLECAGLRENRLRGLIKQEAQNLQWLYERLDDEESKELLVNLMAFRILGHRKVKLPLNTPAYWSTLESLESAVDDKDSIELGFKGWKLGRYDLARHGYPISLYVRSLGAFTQLILQQYRGVVSQDHAIEVCDGDVVIDAGGCYGDTALYFAHKAGRTGKVFSFEFMPDNIKVFKRNLELNLSLSERIEIVDNPLWSETGKKLYVKGSGPSTRVALQPEGSSCTQVETVKIDDLVEQRSVGKVGFIKMDIEGVELEALKGAKRTIERDHPKLAISVYHKLQDFWEIPRWIDSLGIGYKFYLRHFTIHAEETVLFCEVES